MDNSTLIFIIIIEAVVIAWMASKLTQYDKVAKLLNFADAPDSASPSIAKAKSESGVSQGALGASQAESRPASKQVSEPATSSAQSASRAVSDSITSGESEELLDMPGVDPEDNIEEAKRVQLVMARCRYAEFYLEQLDDDYERGQFQRIISSCENTARSIDDPFFRASALQPVIMLLDRAEWSSDRDRLLAEVEDELIRGRITQDLSSDAEA